MHYSLKRNFHDYIVGIITLAIISVFAVLLISFNSTGDNVVHVYYQNDLVHTMYLNIDESYTMKASEYTALLGDLTIEVNNGKVAVVEQTSDKNYCEYMGAVSTRGTSIVCAPNGVVITIEGYEDTGIDYTPGGGE